eukprot:Lithocolla_globosa_v1_NODE_6772_length_1037_cov_6.856415.p1 type:complete len:249 gc:universal NODE_6772_length_1037_cov_6.856415:757-11(-)
MVIGGKDFDGVKLKRRAVGGELKYDFDCENVVKFYGARYSSRENTLMLYSELMTISVSSLLKIISPFPKHVVAKVAYSVVSAISFLKERKTMHRDIKPSNILLNQAGKVKLCDFGLAIELEESLAFTKGLGFGSPLYTSPERINDEPGYSYKVDIWSLGICVHEMASGVHPFGEHMSSNSPFGLMQLMNAICSDNPVKDLEVTHTDVIDFARECLHKNPAHRPTAQQLMSHHLFTEMTDIKPWLETVM